MSNYIIFPIFIEAPIKKTEKVEVYINSFKIGHHSFVDIFNNKYMSRR